MAGMVVERLWIENSSRILVVVWVRRVLVVRDATGKSMVILVVVFVRDSFYFPLEYGGDGCGEVADWKLEQNFGCGVRKTHSGCLGCHRKLDGYFVCGVCKIQFLFPNRAWRGWLWRGCGLETRGSFWL